MKGSGCRYGKGFVDIKNGVLMMELSCVCGVKWEWLILTQELGTCVGDNGVNGMDGKIKQLSVCLWCGRQVGLLFRPDNEDEFTKRVRGNGEKCLRDSGNEQLEYAVPRLQWTVASGVEDVVELKEGLSIMAWKPEMDCGVGVILTCRDNCGK